MSLRPLGRREPQDFDHVEQYPFTALRPSAPERVEETIALPWWHWDWDQGWEGACVGFGTSMMMSLLNSGRRYDPRWLWSEAKEVDEWPDTNPGDDNGTSVRAACDVLRDEGHVRVYRGKAYDPAVAEGISTNRWAQSVDEIRAAIAEGIPVTLGIDWYTNFDRPEKIGTSYWIGHGNLGTIRGGHAVCAYGASDAKQAVKIKNSWGRDFPLAWLPYDVLGDLLLDGGEACLVTDR